MLATPPHYTLILCNTSRDVRPDCYVGAVSEMLVLTVNPDSPSTGILPGSGVITPVHQPASTPAGSFHVWFEGNAYGAVNLRSWADRVHVAAQRALDMAPTTAQSVLPAEDFRVLGFYDIARRRFDWQVSHWRDALGLWLGHAPNGDDLTVSGARPATAG